MWCGRGLPLLRWDWVYGIGPRPVLALSAEFLTGSAGLRLGASGAFRVSAKTARRLAAPALEGATEGALLCQPETRFPKSSSSSGPRTSQPIWLNTPQATR